MVRVILFLLFTSLMFSLTSCSSSIEQTRQEEGSEDEEIYVFDDSPEDKPEVENESLEKENSYFLIQIGAFTTRRRAQLFADESKNKLGREVTVSYSSDVNLFVVQVDKKFVTKKDAELVRNQIREKEEFKDAWIVSIEK
ncbi:MAG: hypothetical protein A2000_11090 [Ignavibacteria bacterium GWB2_36_8]|nr:MAG: hypothetical protein A2000_11090 [Ignavibacteria bacterium GWB2_36_8]OGU51468.1 MAG: hypothetical protein A2080_11180 [Ignavibacteria bacterium GWC2_36_12]OGV08981.1 MAG: hypothetical protein A2330_05630 [Ignavibacteria bacterium RIFOXYB2_FULL_36_7]